MGQASEMRQVWGWKGRRGGVHVACMGSGHSRQGWDSGKLPPVLGQVQRRLGWGGDGGRGTSEGRTESQGHQGGKDGVGLAGQEGGWGRSLAELGHRRESPACRDSRPWEGPGWPPLRGPGACVLREAPSHVGRVTLGGGGGSGAILGLRLCSVGEETQGPLPQFPPPHSLAGLGGLRARTCALPEAGTGMPYHCPEHAQPRLDSVAVEDAPVVSPFPVGTAFRIWGPGAVLVECAARPGCGHAHVSLGEHTANKTQTPPQGSALRCGRLGCRAILLFSSNSSASSPVAACLSAHSLELDRMKEKAL